jgi:hypothetical protein
MVEMSARKSSGEPQADSRRLNAFVQWWRALTDSETVTQRAAKTPTHALKAGLTGLELAEFVRTRFYEDRAYARSRRAVWSARATLLRLVVFGLSAVATIFLGVAAKDGYATVGFICTALVTVVSALEGFFNWRSRWVAAEWALARWHELEENLAMYVSSRSNGKLDDAAITEFDIQRRIVWAELSHTWISERRGRSQNEI